jgi:U3 small nucleolar RNA-associated protein 21
MKQPPLFAPFRALGYITEDVPFVVQRRGKEAFVTVSVGKCWQVAHFSICVLPFRLGFYVCT